RGIDVQPISQGRQLRGGSARNSSLDHDPYHHQHAKLASQRNPIEGGPEATGLEKLYIRAIDKAPQPRKILLLLQGFISDKRRNPSLSHSGPKFPPFFDLS